MYVCTKDLQVEKEIVLYEAPEGIRSDFHGIADQINRLTKELAVLKGGRQRFSANANWRRS